MNQPQSSVSLGRLLVLLVPAAVIVVGIFVYMTMFGGTAATDQLRPEAPVKVTGTVTVDGAPAAKGRIETKPIDARKAGSSADIADDGTFELMLTGQQQVGAYIGEHKVAVVAYSADGEAPATPSDYAETGSTPLIVIVSANTDLNQWKIDIKTTGDKPTVVASAGGSTPVPVGGGGVPAGGAVGPEEIAKRVLSAYDQDDDGKLNGAELEEALGFLAGMAKDPDEDGDGYVTEAELLSSMHRQRAALIEAAGAAKGASEAAGDKPAAPGEPPTNTDPNADTDKSDSTSP